MRRPTRAATAAADGLALSRIDIDRLSSEFEPTRTLRPLGGGGLELVDTTNALIENFDTAGRIVQRKKRTGELTMGFSYADARSDKLEHVSDATGGQTSFAHDGAGKLQRITDARGRITNVTVTELGDLTSFQKSDLETYRFTYAEHRMTQKKGPYGDLTNYTFRPNGTVQTLTKPGGQATTVDAVLSHLPIYGASGKQIRAGGYTDGHGVSHQVEMNLRGDVEKDTYVADGVTRVDQAVYSGLGFIRDVDPANPLVNNSSGALLPEAPGTGRRNNIFRVSHHTINGVATGPERRIWDAHYRPLGEYLPSLNRYTTLRVFAADGWLRGEIAGQANLGQAYARDAAGHVIQSYDSADLNPASPPVSGQTAQYTYRADGQLATKTEHAVTTTFSYDDAGGTLNQLGWTDAVGRSMAYVLDAKGNTTQTSDGPLLVSAPSDEDEGLWVEARFETLDIGQRTVVLEVRTVERDDDDGGLFATSDPVRVICRLETGACTADDDAARVLLSEHPELEARLESHMDHVRQRAWRAVAQRDRETAARCVLANAKPGLMVAFQDLFPADWDLLFKHDGATYWVIDRYCPTPSCDCSSVALTLCRLRTDNPAPLVVGDADVNLARESPVLEVTTPAAREPFAAISREFLERLPLRREEARRAVLRHPAPSPAKPAALSFAAARTPRNAPCPCGSGKKFKRCCVGADPTNTVARIDSVTARRSLS